MYIHPPNDCHIIDNLKNIIVKQSLSLFGASIGLMIVGFGIKYLQTHSLGEIDYGEYAFFASLTTFLALFFRFGFFTSLSVLLAHNVNDVREKRLLGAGFSVALICGILMASAIWLASFLVNDLFKTEMGDILQWVAPLTFILPFEFLISAYATGTNKIKLLSIYKIGPKLLYLLTLLYFFTTDQLSLVTVVVLNLVSSIIYTVFLFIYLNPKFKGIKKSLTLLWLKNKKFGVHEYTGAVFGQSTYKLDQLFISHFVNTTQLGYYSLAWLICTPMVMMSQALNQSIFRDYASRKVIPKKLLSYNLLWLIISVAGLALFGKHIVQFIFGNNFQETTKYILPLSVAFLFHGMYIPYGFLSVKSKGKEIRNTSIVEAIVNIVGNVILIPIYGVIGAIITSIVAKLVHYLMLRYYYHIYLKEQGLL